MKRTVWILTGTIIFTGLIVTWTNMRSAQRTRHMAVELSKRNKSLETKIAAAREQLASHAKDEQNLQTALQEAQARKEPASSPTQKPAPARREMADLMETRPALRALFKQSSRANLILSYQPFYDAAHLSPEQINKFEELMTESEQDKLDLQAAAKAQGLSAKDPALAKMRQLSDEKLQSAQKEILDDAGYQELQRYNRQRPLSGFATSLASLMAYNGDPITAQQCRQLLDALSSASSQFQSGGRVEIGTITTPLVIQQAGQILSPGQLALLQANSNIIVLSKLRDQFYQQKKTVAK